MDLGHCLPNVLHDVDINLGFFNIKISIFILIYTVYAFFKSHGKSRDNSRRSTFLFSQ